MKNKLFIFDLDGTILKLDISQKQLSEVREKISEYFKEYNISDNFRPLIPKIIFLAKIVAEDEVTKEEIIRKAFSVIDEVEVRPAGGIKVKQDNVDLLKELKKRKMKIGIISNNGKKGVLNALGKMGLNEDFFTFLITRDDVPLPKPFVDPYLKIKQYLDEEKCYIFTDDVFDFLPLINLDKIYHWNIKKYLVLQMDIRNQSYEWVSLEKMNFDKACEQNRFH
jgi:HAD superfamily hydrolase (TIGR01549 family)